MPSSQDVQQLLYIYELLGNQEETLRQQISMLNNQTQGVNISKQTMEEFRVLPPNHESLIPIGNNAYTSAKLLNPEKVVVKINKDVLIEKDLEEGIKSMDKLLKTYQNLNEKLNAQLKDVQSKLNQIKPQIEQIYRRQGMNPQ